VVTELGYPEPTSGCDPHDVLAVGLDLIGFVDAGLLHVGACRRAAHGGVSTCSDAADRSR
jgi:hypothetical protein